MAEYIERETAIKAVRKNDVEGYATWAVKAIPAADVAPVRHGHWVAKEDYNLDIYYDCSVCGESWDLIDGDPWDNGMNYCPHCGAKMDGAEDV